MTARLFVGNLPFTTTAAELRALFAAAGDVLDVAVPTDRLDGRPHGFAFVEMASAEEATAAVSRFDGADLGGRALRVNPAEQRGSGPASPAAGRFGADRPSRRPRAKGSRRNLRSRKRGF